MIRNLLFDLGNVLLPIDPAATASALENLMGMPYANLLSQPDEMLTKFETGKVNYIVFFNYLSKIAPKVVHINELLPAWNKMLLPLRQDTVTVLQDLSKDFRCFILSNTNEVHIRHFDQQLKSLGLYELWYKKIFTKSFFSHELGFRKPQPEIFDAVIHDANISARETIYLDDLQINVDAASRMGFHSFNYLFDQENLQTFIRNKMQQIK